MLAPHPRRPRGLLAAALVLAACGQGDEPAAGGPPPPTSGLFASPQFEDAELAIALDVEYSRRPNEGGVQYTSTRTMDEEVGTSELVLRLDVAVPPNAAAATPAPAVVWVHGGGYVGGSKEDVHDHALSYARAGYVAATINYRLTPDNDRSPEVRQRAIVQATEDAMNAIRFLKVHAATYHLDPDRIAAFGSSAGGGIVLIDAVEYDTLAGAASDHAGVSSRVAAAISTGATLFDHAGASYAFDFDAADTPVLLFHARETDSVTGATWTGSVLPTQQAINASGNTCEVVAQPDLSHTVNLALGSKWWDEVWPFLWTRLRLAEVRP